MNTSSSSTVGTCSAGTLMAVIGGFVILLILFSIFNNRNGNGVFGGGNDYSCLPSNPTQTLAAQSARTGAELSFANYGGIKELAALTDKNDAVLKGDLDLGFRTVMNNADNNARDIMLSDEKRENQNLRDQLFRAESRAEKLEILGAVKDQGTVTNARLCEIENRMAKEAPTYSIGCSPCAVNPCNNQFGNVFSSNC